jgi:hypothetical protein
MYLMEFAHPFQITIMIMKSYGYMFGVGGTLILPVGHVLLYPATGEDNAKAPEGGRRKV